MHMMLSEVNLAGAFSYFNLIIRSQVFRNGIRLMSAMILSLSFQLEYKMDLKKLKTYFSQSRQRKGNRVFSPRSLLYSEKSSLYG